MSKLIRDFNLWQNR